MSLTMGGWGKPRGVATETLLRARMRTVYGSHGTLGPQRPGHGARETTAFGLLSRLQQSQLVNRPWQTPPTARNGVRGLSPGKPRVNNNRDSTKTHSVHRLKR